MRHVSEVNNIVEGKPSQRPGKERARMPSLETEEQHFMTLLSDSVGEKQRRSSSTGRSDSLESLVEVQGESSRRGRGHRQNHKFSVDFESSSDSKSTKVSYHRFRSTL